MASDSKNLYFGFVVDVFSEIVHFFSSKQNTRQLTLVSKNSERTSGLTESSILVSRWQVIQKLAIVVFIAHFFGKVYFNTRKGGGG